LHRLTERTQTKEIWSPRKLSPKPLLWKADGNPYHFWKDVVKYYSRCALTKASDKFIALSGLAELVHDRLGGQDRYLAGLWESELAYTLLWMVDDKSSRSSKMPLTYRAPTWSWASVDAVVSFIDIDERKTRNARDERSISLVLLLLFISFK
jgi:hypothetical protein